MKALPYVLALILLPKTLLGAFERMPPGARGSTLATSCGVLKGDLPSCLVNPALAALVNARALAFWYVPALYEVNELKRYGATYVESYGWGAVAASFDRFGSEGYYESVLDLSSGCRLRAGLSVGISLRVYHLGIVEYGSANAIGLGVGMMWVLSDRFSYACVLRNANQPTLGSAVEPLPQTLELAGAYNPFDEVNLYFGLVKDADYPLETGFGLEYRLVRALRIFAGIRTEPSSWSAGVGLLVGRWTLDCAFDAHPDLGCTYAFTLGYGVE